MVSEVISGGYHEGRPIIYGGHDFPVNAGSSFKESRRTFSIVEPSSINPPVDSLDKRACSKCFHLHRSPTNRFSYSRRQAVHR